MTFQQVEPAEGFDALILARRDCLDFPSVPEPWRPDISRMIAYFQQHKIESADSKSKQQDYSALARSEGPDELLPVHLSSLPLGSRTTELGSESAALLQWGKSLAGVISKEKWQRPLLPLIPGLSLEQFRLVLEGLWFGSYQFNELQKKKEQPGPVLTLLGDASAELEVILADMALQTEALQQTLKLVLSPANICTPTFFSDFVAEQLADLGARPSRIRSDIWGEERLAKEGMNLILAVGQGSPQESRLLLLDYQGDPTSAEHIALVGKGVCFDTGGTDLKNSTNLKGMQYDMMGGAIVYGAFYYLAASGIQANIRAYVPLVENQIGCEAIKTGDIIRSAMGPTVEINNTDAEGRLILADAIHHAVQQKPRLLLDCATLTGAAIVALGEQCAAYYSNDERVAELFAQASRETGEDVWRMPLFRPYASFLESKLADMSNISTKSDDGGSITAALFLEKFAAPHKQEPEGTQPDEETPAHAWLHLDLAAWSSPDEHPSLGKNVRAMGVRLLSSFVRKYLAV